MFAEPHSPTHTTTVRNAMFLWLNYERQSAPPTAAQWKKFERACGSLFTAPWIINPDSTLCRYLTISSPVTTHIADPSPRAIGLLSAMQTALFNSDLEMFNELFHTAINFSTNS